MRTSLATPALAATFLPPAYRKEHPMSRAQSAMSARVRAGAALFAAAAFALAFVPGASATEPWTSVGLTKAYTYHADCKTPGLIDPINVVWTGGNPTPWGVEARLHKGSEQGVWTYNDTTFFFGKDTFEDKQVVYRSEGGCKTDQAAPATAEPWATERQHARLFHTTKKNLNGSYTGYVVADAHEDVENGNCKHHHAAENYPRAKDNLTKEWEFIQLERNEYKEPKSKYWANYETVLQCNNDFPISNGYVEYLYGGKATAKAAGVASEEQEAPEITGFPTVGNQLTATPGVWEPRPSAFTYEWAISEPNQNTWTVVQSGENANTWSPSASDVGKLVSVRVRPVGAESWQAVSGSPVQIVNVKPPTVTTEGATAIGSHAATLEATVNPNGADTHYYFEYGKTSGQFESTAPALPGGDAGAGTSPVHVTTSLSGLAPYTTYYYRSVASNAAGTSYGAQKDFTTTASGTLSAGAKVTCALVSSGAVDCWGENYFDEMGNGSSQKQFTTPVAVPGITNAIEVAAGGSHVCALLADGSVKCWGDNQFGELGIGYTSKDSTPVRVTGITNAIAITAGAADTCALLSGGTIDCWGANIYGELGNGTTTNSSTPVPVSGITNAVAVTAGYVSTCATLSSRGVDCWGYNAYGEVGNGTTTNSSTPVPVSGITTASAAAVPAVGAFHTCAPLSSGGVDCWGYNEQGQLGNGTTSRDSLSPVAVSAITNATTVAAGYYHTCASLSGGGADCWGENPFGELGNGTRTNSSTPVAVSGITRATGVTGGEAHSCARLIGGGVDCWGDNIDGQLGNGTTTSSLTPVTVTGLP
jgi:alpha-tubulin suppressor-like RCC1 family protein